MRLRVTNTDPSDVGPSGGRLLEGVGPLVREPPEAPKCGYSLERGLLERTPLELTPLELTPLERSLLQRTPLQYSPGIPRRAGSEQTLDSVAEQPPNASGTASSNTSPTAALPTGRVVADPAEAPPATAPAATTAPTTAPAATAVPATAPAAAPALAAVATSIRRVPSGALLANGSHLFDEGPIHISPSPARASSPSSDVEERRRARPSGSALGKPASSLRPATARAAAIASVRGRGASLLPASSSSDDDDDDDDDSPAGFRRPGAAKLRNGGLGAGRYGARVAAQSSAPSRSGSARATAGCINATSAVGVGDTSSPSHTTSRPPPLSSMRARPSNKPT